MRIVTARRISQVFFLLLFLGFGFVASWGEEAWQLRGWPVDWFLELDPLVAIGTTLAAGTLAAGLAWAALTLALTAFLGRFFCGWVCPFGTVHQAVGWMGQGFRTPAGRVRVNRPHPAQNAKYYVLTVILCAAGAGALARMARSWFDVPALFPGLVFAAAAGLAWASVRRVVRSPGRAAAVVTLLFVALLLLGRTLPDDETAGAVNLAGLLDPIPLFQRSVNLLVLPLLDRSVGFLFVAPRYVQGSALILAVFAAAVLLNLVVPRFYCRFVCPLGALLGLVGRTALGRIGRTPEGCTACGLCDAACEGACDPSGTIRTSECVLCMNCLPACKPGVIAWSSRPSPAGERPLPDLGRRGLLISAVSGVAAVPALRLAGGVGPDWNPSDVRPPGAIPDPGFADRCIKCGECMRVCPTGVLQPAGLEGGLEGLWTPVLNMRIGSSACQANCVACGHVCPTGAIRPLTVDRKLGRGGHAKDGPVRIGTAFVDRGRCLPWAFDRPCIVCQEVCPVSPKAIRMQEVLARAPEGPLPVAAADGASVTIDRGVPARLAGGDHLCRPADRPDWKPRALVGLSGHTLSLGPGDWPAPPAAGSFLEVLVRLHQPIVDTDHCTGCGICEHDCPVGLRAIRVTAEGESRHPKRRMVKG